MIRIKPGRCGYGGEKGYTCQRLPQLQEWMFNESNAFVSQMTAEFDKLPLRVKGIVFTEETIDMGWSEFGPHPEVPELSCRSNTDPASDATDVSVWGSTGIPVEVGNATAYPVYGGSSGWLDLFNSGYEITGGTQYFYHNISGTTAATSDVYIKVTGVEHEYHDIYLVSNIPTFRNGEQEMEMGPGLLEPMLDTDFAPVGIDTIPAWEAGLDADIFTNIVLNAWKGVIDDRIRNIYWRLNTLPAYDTDQKLRDLTAAENKDSECSNFQITLTSGSPVRDPDDVDANKHHAPTLPNADNTSTPITVGSTWHSKTVTAVWQDADTTWWWTVEEDPNLYAISGGEIAYGDNTISVAGLSGLYAPFYAYLMPSLDVTITHTDVKAADVPTVPVEGGTTRMIEDGDVLPSGGTVTGFTSSGSGTTLRYAWETVGDNTAEIVTKTGPQLTAEGTADPEPGGIGIGGVRIIQSDAESDPLVLYKIYHEDCISEIDKPEAEAEAATAGWIRLSPVFPYGEELMDVEIPSGTEGVEPTVIGATAGIVQPVHNIQIHGSTEYRTQSPVDVPTVEAVYNFIHNYDDFADGEFEQASALATGSTMYANGSTVAIYTKEISGYTGSLAVPGTVIVATDIKTILVDGNTVTAYGCVPTAQAVVDYIGELTFDGVESTVGIIGYTTNVPETLWPIPGSTVDPASGYVQNVRNIYVAGTHSVSGYAVPTVDAVYNFIHNIAVEGMTFSSALVTGGTLAETTATVEDVTTVTGYTATGEPGTCYMATVIPYGSTVAIGLDDCAPTLDAVIGYVSTFVSGYTATGGTISAPEDTEESWVSGHAGTAGIVTLSNNVIMASDPSNRSLSPYTVPTVEAVVLYVSAYLSGTTAGHLVYGDPAETIADAIVGRATVAGNIYLNTDPEYRDASKQAVPTVEAVYNFIKGGTVYGKQGWVYSDAHATAGTIAASETQGSAHIVTGVTASGCIPGTCDIVSNIVGATNTTTGAVFSVTNVVPTADAVVQYVNATLKPVAVNGLIQIVTGGTEQLWETDPPAAAGIVQPVTNILVGSAVNHAESSKDVPTVLAVYEFVHNYDTSTIASPLAVPVDMHTIGNAATVGITASGSTPGTFFVTGNMEVVYGATAFPAPAVVPTAEAVAKYVELHGGTGGDGILPNYQGLQVLSGVGSGTNGIGIGYLLPVSPDEKTWFEVDSNLGYDAVFATENDTTGTAMSAGMANAVSSSVAGYIRLCIIDPGQNQTAGCVRLYTENATRGVPLYKSNGFALPASGNSIISVSGNNESVSGDPGRVYISNGVNFGGDRAYSKITAPSVEAVYDFIHGTTASGVQMLSSLADIAGSTITGTTALALVYTAKPGTVYVTDDFTLLGGTVTTYNNPQAVPTALAVHNYIAGLNLDSPAVPGTLEATSSSEAWDENDTAVLGTVLVSKNVTVSTTGNTISTVAVPTVAAVHTFVSGYTASPGTLTINGSAGTNTVEGGSFGIVITTDNVQVNASSGTDDADYAVPTVQAVYDFMHETDTSAGIRALATGGTITAPVSGVSASLESTATPGTCYIATDMTGMSGTNVVLDSPVSVVPSVNAVKQYVDSHNGGYDGPFAVGATGTGTNVKIASGKAYFGSGDPFVYAGVASRAMANGTTLFLVCTKGNTNATIATTNTTGATVACFPIASKDASGNITQRQWGDINIMGRWM